MLAGFLFPSECSSKLGILPETKIPAIGGDFALDCDLAGARTQDPYIKSVLLYQLSYQVKKNEPARSAVCGCKYKIYLAYIK